MAIWLDVNVTMWSWDGKVCVYSENCVCLECVWGSMVLWECVFVLDYKVVRCLNWSVFDDVCVCDGCFFCLV